MKDSPAQADVLGRMLVIQETLDVMPDTKGMAGFLSKALLQTPGVSRIQMCIGGVLMPHTAETDAINARCSLTDEGGVTDSSPSCDCPFSKELGVKFIPLRTSRDCYGALLFIVSDTELFAPYEPFLTNIANVVATTLENRSYLQQLNQSNESLKEARDELEIKALERTEELRRSQERQALILMGVNDGFWDWNIVTGEVYYSPRWAEMLGYSQEELEPSIKPWKNILHPDDTLSAFRKLDAHLEGHSDKYESEQRLLTKPGEYRWFLMRGQVVARDESGRPTRMTGSTTDITTRKMDEEVRLKLSAAIEQTAEPVIITDRAGLIEYVNPAFEKTTGYPASEALGQNTRILKSGKHGAAYYRDMWDTLNRGEIWHGRFTNRRKDGTLYEAEASITPVTTADNQTITYVSVQRDVTYEASLERARRYFTAVTSHQLATPLTRLQLLKMLLDKVKESENVNDNLDLAFTVLNESYESLDRIACITKLLTNLSFAVTASSFSLVSIKKTLIDCTGMAAQMIQKNSRTLSFAADFDSVEEDCVVAGDAEMIKVAINELLSNAIKYTPDGKGVCISAKREEGMVITIIRDEGIGIPPEKKNDLFEPYFSLEDPDRYSTGLYKYKGGGIGLGLKIAKLIVEQHRGELNIQSAGTGMGSTVTLKFPLATR